ncbi:hypothetical protein [Azospirillum argentinense]
MPASLLVFCAPPSGHQAAAVFLPRVPGASAFASVSSDR